MPVTSEPRLRVNNGLPDTSVIRHRLVGPVIYSEKTYNSEWSSECDRLGEDYVVSYLRDVVYSLPDADILDLSYVHREEGLVNLALAFSDKLTAYNELGHRVDRIIAAVEQ